MADLNIGNSSSSVVVNAKHNGSVTPQIDNTYDLGTSDLRWKNIYGGTFVGSLSGNATTATNANKLTTSGHLDTVEKLDAFIESNKLKFATVASIGGVASDGMIISVPWNTSWGHQIFLDDSAMVMQHRHRYTKTNSDGSKVQAWSGWATLLDSNNYNNYAPSKTGTGASGTWGINISGNSATATKLATARTISLTGSVTGSGTFDGSGNLSIATTTNHTHSTATTSANGFMSSDDKAKLDGITASADAVSFSRSLTSGTKVGTITINGTGTDLYAPTNTDTKNTTGSTDTSSKIFLVGATSQEANPQTYSDNQVYAQNGQLNGSSIRVAEKVTLQYDVTNECLNFVFN